ncbi:hypothetical protein EDB85DRAFT_678763 [Lactarius pseudohatsudake]|nr:hypothetical protein EDB85DRAFT_678763 [Lactarius pseudohatsudake]
MTSSRANADLESQTHSDIEPRLAVTAGPRPTTDTQPPDNTVPQPTDIAHPQAINTTGPHPTVTVVSQPQVSNINERHHGNASAPRIEENPGAQRGENQGDSSDGLWSMYLTEAEKQDDKAAESWKGDTDGILVFTGLFSATVATFIIESYKQLSPDSSNTTNALLIQLSRQLVNISNGSPLESVAAQINQPFEPTASAVRVNVLWFLSLVFSLTCALSATLMQQWARRYQELAQRRGAPHRRGYVRAYIFDGLSKFEMARAVATMPMLLHVSVFLFFVGLVEFLFPIDTTVSYFTLVCIVMFALAYVTLTVLPNIFFNCPYATPLSGLTWYLSQSSVLGLLWAKLGIEDLFHKPLSKLRSLANLPVMGPDERQKWRETVENQVKNHRRWFSQGLRKSVELSATRAPSTVVASALEWTLTVLDEDKEIEDFAAHVPGFFDSRIVPNAISAILPLMSHEPKTDPIFGSRLHSLLKTCTPRTSLLKEAERKNRLRVCLKCLWYFGRAYNQPGSGPLPSYFPDTLVRPAITRLNRADTDPVIRVIERCFEALIVNKLTADVNSRTDSTIREEELTCISTILGTEDRDAMPWLSQPGAIGLANIVSLKLADVDSSADTDPSNVLYVAQETLTILLQALFTEENAKQRLHRTVGRIIGSDGKFRRVLESNLHDFLKMCISKTLPLKDEVRTQCLRVCLECLWYIGRAYNQPGASELLPSYFPDDLASPAISRHIRAESDPVIRMIGLCFEALVVSKLTTDIKSRTNSNVQISDKKLACLSAILGAEDRDVTLWLSQPGAIELANVISLTWTDVDSLSAVPSDVLDILKETFSVLSRDFLAQKNVDLPQDMIEQFHEIYSRLINTGVPPWLNEGLLHMSKKLTVAGPVMY